MDLRKSSKIKEGEDLLITSRPQLFRSGVVVMVVVTTLPQRRGRVRIKTNLNTHGFLSSGETDRGVS